MFEESECPLQKFKETYITVFVHNKFPIINFYTFCHNKSWSGPGSGLDPFWLDPDADSAKYLDPDQDMD
jgi:hypothetical protein